MGKDEPREAMGPPPPARPDPPAAGGGRKPRPGRPPSVRDAVGEAKPTPVRDSVDPSTPDPSPPVDAAPEHRMLAYEGTEWVVRVRGRGRAGADTRPAPLLVLGFFRSRDQEVPDREALVVARSLDELTARQLEGALRVSRPPPDPDAKKELFPETATKGRRGDG